METKRALKEKNIIPSKRMGQNFLVSQSIIRKIVSTASLKKEDIVLEVGPGLGALTREIAKTSKVIAVEKDKRLADSLNIKNVEVIQQDILDFENTLKDYKLISNLPYSLAVAVIMKFLEEEFPPKEMFVMTQKEVAQRIISKPPKMEKLGVFSQFYSSVKIEFIISKDTFFPKPKVDSALLRISNIVKPDIDVKLFSKIVNIGFSHKRKTLLNNFSSAFNFNKEKAQKWLEENNIDPGKRAQSLSVDNWVSLTKTLVVE